MSTSADKLASQIKDLPDVEKLRLVDALFVISLPFLLLPRFKAVAWGPKWAFQLT